MITHKDARTLLAMLALTLFGYAAHAQFSASKADPEANDSPERRAQGQPPPPVGPPARAPDKLYAFTGGWSNDVFVPSIVAKGVIPLDAEHEAIRAKLESDRKAGIPLDGNEPKCIPNGPIMSMTSGGMTNYATATELTMVLGRLTRHIAIDGKHTPDNLLFDSYAGESVAHWEGNDLVVDTVGVKPEVEVDWGIPLGENSKLHLVERFRIVGPSKMEVDTTVNDPGMLTRPWKFTRHYTRAATVMSGECIAANDHSRDKATGKPGLDLTPPKTKRFIPPGAAE